MQGLLDGKCGITIHRFRGPMEGVDAAVTVHFAELGHTCASSTPWLVGVRGAGSVGRADRGWSGQIHQKQVGQAPPPFNVHGYVASYLPVWSRGLLSVPNMLEVASDSTLEMYTQHSALRSAAVSMSSARITETEGRIDGLLCNDLLAYYAFSALEFFVAVHGQFRYQEKCAAN